MLHDFNVVCQSVGSMRVFRCGRCGEAGTWIAEREVGCCRCWVIGRPTLVVSVAVLYLRCLLHSPRPLRPPLCKPVAAVECHGFGALGGVRCLARWL